MGPQAKKLTYIDDLTYSTFVLFDHMLRHITLILLNFEEKNLPHDIERPTNGSNDKPVQTIYRFRVLFFYISKTF